MKKYSNNRWGKAALTAATSTLAIMAVTPAATAQEPVAATAQQQVNISAGPLDDALIIVSETFGVTVIAPNELVSGKSAPAVSGSFSAEQVIDRLLVRSGLQFDRSSSGAYIVTAVAAEMRPAQTAQLVDIPVEDEPEPRIEDVIVVTGRFQQSLIDRIPIAPQELPFTINTLDRDLIDQRNFGAPFDTIFLVPNINPVENRTGFGGGEFTVRGYTGGSLVNNRALPFGGTRPDDSFVDRYEVLKGPASIALGPVEPGGIVNLVTKNPELNRFVDLEVTTDQFGTIETEFDFNAGALTPDDRVRARISGAYRDFEFDADLTELEQIAIRSVVEVDLTSVTFAQVSLAYQENDARPNGPFPLFSDGSIPDEFDTSTFFSPAGEGNRSDDWFLEAQVTHEFLDNLRLKMRGNYQNTKLSQDEAFPGIYNYSYDDGTAGIGLGNPVFYQYFGYDYLTERDNFLLDAQLSGDFSAFGQRHDVVVGVSYYENSGAFFSRPGTAFLGPFPLTDAGTQLSANLPDVPIEKRGELDDELMSVYAEFALRPTNWLSVIGGVRYDELSETDFGPTGEVTGELEKSDVTFRLGVSGEVVEGLSAYISVAQSFAPQFGVLVTREPAPPANGDSYEVGLKGALFDNKLSYTLNLFDTRRANVAVQDVENRSDGFFPVTTIGKQRNRGVELSAQWRPTDALYVDLNYGHIDIDVLEASDVFGFVRVMPKNTLNTFANYQFQSGVLTGFELGGGLRYVSSQPSEQSPEVDFPDVLLGDVRISYPITPAFTASLNVINVTDETYLKPTGYGRGNLGGGSQFGEPRTFRLTLRSRF